MRTLEEELNALCLMGSTRTFSGPGTECCCAGRYVWVWAWQRSMVNLNYQLDCAEKCLGLVKCTSQVSICKGCREHFQRWSAKGWRPTPMYAALPHRLEPPRKSKEKQRACEHRVLSLLPACHGVSSSVSNSGLPCHHRITGLALVTTMKNRIKKHTHVILALGGQRQEDQEFRATLCCMKPCLKKLEEKNKKRD